MGEDFGYFGGPASARPSSPPPPAQQSPPAPPPPPPPGAGYGWPPPPPIGSYTAGMAMPPGGRVAVAEMSAQEQAMLLGATTTSYTQMGTGSTLRTGHYPLGGKISFWERIVAGLDLAKTCWRVLRDEPALLLVPFVATLVGAVLFGLWYVVNGGFPPAGTNRQLVALQLSPLMVCLAIVGTVANAVLVSAATTRLEGLHPELGKAWAQALSRLPQLVGFALILAGERMLTNALRNTKLLGGGLIAGAVDRAWDFASFLAIPVILYESAQPFRAVTRSGQLVASRWGTQLTARGVLSLALFVVAVPLLIALVLVGFFFAPVVGLVLLVLGLVLVSTVSAALSGILSAAMYRFATTGLVVPGFREADMWRVFSRA